MIKGLVLDLDGVITDTAEYHYLAWKSLAEKIGIDIDRTFNEQLKGISRIESLELILEHGGKDQSYSEEEKEMLAGKKNDEYKTFIERITPADLCPGMEKLLLDAKEAGLALSVASASKNASTILEQLQVKDQFTGVVDPNSLKNGKPNPEIFYKGAELLGLSPAECIGIEDAEAGIDAINDAGMFSVGVGSKESMKAANYFVENTEELDLKKMIEKAENK
ncbi:beta-phosphoglucomutase [Marinilactibacillus psychrotolerans]|uniref:Beta-phosphoglucomutase n=2 Tax=Marinilactibacillus psychrotolerans TaxID=191770 RepID=A0ABW8ULC2_9LACT|nr:beta-phosphoglucomutase [Marinilactibacillus psychrotolerans]GEQ33959.1 beta-phosphoglucomutase [Marinilactibacillus psychrotolerans]SJN23947.1 Beta-phosphoglucomutase [Marinilactibacillus psychrotolerans 42ea]